MRAVEFQAALRSLRASEMVDRVRLQLLDVSLTSPCEARHQHRKPFAAVVVILTYSEFSAGHMQC